MIPKNATRPYLDKTLTVKVADLPETAVLLSSVDGSSLPLLFPGGSVRSGRIGIYMDDPSTADLAVIAADEDDSVIGFEITLVDADDNDLYTAGVNVPVTDIAGSVSIPWDELEFASAEITITDPFFSDTEGEEVPALTSLILAWIPDA